MKKICIDEVGGVIMKKNEKKTTFCKLTKYFFFTNFFWLLLWLCISKMICKTWKGAPIIIIQNFPQQLELMILTKKWKLPNIGTNSFFRKKWAQVIKLLGEKILRWPHLDVEVMGVPSTKQKLEKIYCHA
jgi:hypothetical protein